MNIGRRLGIGAALLGLLALITGLARMVYGPGETLGVEQLPAAVLQLEDVPGAQQAETCGDEYPIDTERLPENAVFVVFRLPQEPSSDAPLVCVQAGSRAMESHLAAVTALQEAVDSFPVYEQAVEEPSLEGAVNLERIKIASFGDRSFSYTLGCGRDCTPEDTRSYIIQFQRSNVLSFISVSGQESDGLLDDAIEYARRQDQRIVAALGADD